MGVPAEDVHEADRDTNAHEALAMKLKRSKTTLKMKARRSPGRWSASKSRPAPIEHRVGINDNSSVSG